MTQELPPFNDELRSGIIGLIGKVNPEDRPPRPSRALRSQPLTDQRTATAKFHDEGTTLRQRLSCSASPGGAPRDPQQTASARRDRRRGSGAVVV